MRPSGIQPIDLREVIQNERVCGSVTLDVIGIAGFPILERCNQVVRHVGLMPPEQWVSLPATAARLHLLRCLHRDLAYDFECIAVPRAEQLADLFFSLLGEGARQYFTNGLPWKPSVYDRALKAKETGLVVITEDEVLELGWGERMDAWTYTGLTKSTFDTGVVGITSYQAGILWFEDED
jgi:hypothetical protein